VSSGWAQLLDNLAHYASTCIVQHAQLQPGVWVHRIARTKSKKAAMHTATEIQVGAIHCQAIASQNSSQDIIELPDPRPRT
jgi:hypothetical protein